MSIAKALTPPLGWPRKSPISFTAYRNRRLLSIVRNDGLTDLNAAERDNLPWAAPQKETFYGGGAAGYIDYPTLKQA